MSSSVAWFCGVAWSYFQIFRTQRRTGACASVRLQYGNLARNLAPVVFLRLWRLTRQFCLHPPRVCFQAIPSAPIRHGVTYNKRRVYVSTVSTLLDTSYRSNGKRKGEDFSNDLLSRLPHLVVNRESLSGWVLFCVACVSSFIPLISVFLLSLALWGLVP